MRRGRPYTEPYEPYERRTLGWLSSIVKPETPLYLIGWLAAALILILVLVVFWSTFVNGLPSVKNLFSNLGFENYRAVFSNPILPRAALNTVISAVGTTIVALVFATIIAWLVHRTNVRFKKIFITLMLVHSVLPGFVRIMGWIMLLSPKVGLVNQLIRLVSPAESGPLNCYNLPFMIFLQGISLTPVLFLMLGGAFMAIDPSFEEAAEANGMNKRQVFWHVSLPLLKPALIAGAIYVFVTALSMFEVPALLGSPYNIWFMSTLMFTAVQPDVGMPQFGIAGVFGLIVLVPTLIALYYYQKMIKVSHRYRTVTGKGYRPKFTDIGKWRWLGLAFILFYFLIDLVFPYLAVLWTSLSPKLQIPSLTAFKNLSLEGYREGADLIGRSSAIGHTVQLLLVVGFLSMAVGLIISWVTMRTRAKGRFALDTIAMVPQVVPGIATAFAGAFIGIMLVKYVPLYGSVWIIVMVQAVRCLPFTTRTIGSSLIQIHPELEEAVQTSGGSKGLALRKVIIPLITPAVLYSFVWAILSSYREVTTPLFLLTPKNQVLSTVIWTQWTGNGNFDAAAAISVMMVGVMAVFILILLYAFPQIRKGMQLH